MFASGDVFFEDTNSGFLLELARIFTMLIIRNLGAPIGSYFTSLHIPVKYVFVFYTASYRHVGPIV